MLERLRIEVGKRTPESIFLLIAVFFGVLFVFLVPPTQAADETTHFNRAYQISDGHILSKSIDQGYGDYLPRKLQADTKQLFGDIPSHYDRLFNYHQLPGLLKQKVDTKDKVFVHLEGSTVYSPIPYLPQVGAILIAKVLWPSTLLMYYLARLANLAVWIGLMYLAIRIWPANKWPLFVIALLPMSLSQAATASPDALGNSLAFLTISYFVYLAKTKRQIHKKQIALMITTVTLLSLSKPVFFVLGLLAFIFATSQLKNLRRYYAFAVGLILSSLSVTAIWNSFVKPYSLGIQHFYYPALNIDKHQQFVHILTHPFSFIYTLGNTYLSSLGNIVTTSFVGRLGWWDTDLPLWLIVAAFVVLVMAIINRDPAEKRFSKRIRVTTLLVFIAGYLATSAILYLTITQLDAEAINNVQGRYFIAFVPLLIPAFAGLLRVQDWHRISSRLFPIASSLILAVSLIVVVNRFI